MNDPAADDVYRFDRLANRSAGKQKEAGETRWGEPRDRSGSRLEPPSFLGVPQTGVRLADETDDGEPKVVFEDENYSRMF